MGFGEIMDLGEATTVTKLKNVVNEGESCYLLICWQVDSFEMYLYNKNKLWKGRFSPNRLAGFSRNLHVSEVEYYDNIKLCLSQEKENYSYELKSGFFYWKRKEKNEVIIEGFLPMELDESPKNLQPDLVEILLNLNTHLKDKVNGLKNKFDTIKADYQKCLRDTEEFLSLKIDMEKALCAKFLSLLSIKKTHVDALQHNQPSIKHKDAEEAIVKI